jgi:hexokinase
MIINTGHISNAKILRYIYEGLYVSTRETRKIIKDFHFEMFNGLSGRKSSLKMLPTYVDKPTGGEKGKFIALDLGGTNLRVLELELKGKGNIALIAEKRFILQRKHINTTGQSLFDFIADCVRDFIRNQKTQIKERINLGFTFSFPIKQMGIDSGELVHWTKGFSAKGVEGKDVIKLLRGSLLKKGLNSITISALTNDTVGTLVTRGYIDRDCDIGVILGTGTNACYREKISNIPKLKGSQVSTDHMIVNIEWGNFNKLRRLAYDLQLDYASVNRGQQILEKMVSGKYLGEIVRIIFKDLIKRKMLFQEKCSFIFDARGSFKTEYMSSIANDRTKGLSEVDKIFKKLGISKSVLEDRLLVKKICHAVSCRAARVSAAALASVIIKIDPHLSGKHTVAIDGTVYEKYPGFRQKIRLTLRELFGRKSARVNIVLTKDGSGRGAAIIAALAAGVNNR